MAKRSSRRDQKPVPSHEEARQLAADATTPAEMEAAFAAFRGHVGARWFEVRTPAKIDRAARMLAGAARGSEMHLAADMTADEILSFRVTSRSE